MNGIEKAEGLDISEPSAYFIVPDGIRTHGLPLRRRMLYPAELRRHEGAEHPMMKSGFHRVIQMYKQIGSISINALKLGQSTCFASRLWRWRFLRHAYLFSSDEQSPSCGFYLGRDSQALLFYFSLSSMRLASFLAALSIFSMSLPSIITRTRGSVPDVRMSTLPS